MMIKGSKTPPNNFSLVDIDVKGFHEDLTAFKPFVNIYFSLVVPALDERDQSVSRKCPFAM